MVSQLGIGIGAGLVSALLTAVVATGQPLALLLFFLAPLPIVIASLGWKHTTGLIAGLVGALMLAMIFRWQTAVIFLLSSAVPAWFFSYLSLLARDDGRGQKEWFPVSLVFAAIILGTALLTLLAIVSLGRSDADFAAQIDQFITRMNVLNPGLMPTLAPTEREQLVRLMVLILPPMTAIMSVLTTTAMFYLGAKAVQTSGRLPRPWPALAWETRLPGFAFPLLLGGILLGNFDGFIGLASRITAAAVFAGCMVQGLAVLHALAGLSPARLAILSAFYALIVLLGGWPLILIGLIGLADSLIDFRRRLSKGGTA